MLYNYVFAGKNMIVIMFFSGNLQHLLKLTCEVFHFVRDGGAVLSGSLFLFSFYIENEKWFHIYALLLVRNVSEATV